MLASWIKVQLTIERLPEFKGDAVGHRAEVQGVCSRRTNRERCVDQADKQGRGVHRTVRRAEDHHSCPLGILGTPIFQLAFLDNVGHPLFVSRALAPASIVSSGFRVLSLKGFHQR